MEDFASSTPVDPSGTDPSAPARLIRLSSEEAVEPSWLADAEAGLARLSGTTECPASASREQPPQELAKEADTHQAALAEAHERALEEAHERALEEARRRFQPTLVAALDELSARAAQGVSAAPPAPEVSVTSPPPAPDVSVTSPSLGAGPAAALTLTAADLAVLESVGSRGGCGDRDGGDASREELRESLARLRVGELKVRAQHARVDPSEVERAIDEADDPKAAVVELILSRLAVRAERFPEISLGPGDSPQTRRDSPGHAARSESTGAAPHARAQMPCHACHS